MFLGLTDFVLAHRKLVVALTVLSVLGFGWGLGGLTADTDVTNDLPQRIPAKALYDRIDEMFPSKEVVIVGVEGELWSADAVGRMAALTERLEGLAGVQSVMSPTNARIIRGVEGGMEVREAADPLPETEAEAEAFKQTLFSQPLFLDTLVSRDGEAAALLVFIKGGAREADVAERLIELANDPERRGGFTLHVTGRAAATYWSKVMMGKDMGMLTSLALLVVIALLVISFRSGRGVLLPLGVVVVSVIWTLGLMGWLGVPISHSTEVLPILLVAIGVADGIHILKGYYERARGETDAAAVVRATMADLNRPVVLTSITTAVGFLALNTSGIESIMTLGLLTAFGVMAAMVFSLTFVPAVLASLKLPKVKTAAVTPSSAEHPATPEAAASADPSAAAPARGRFVALERIADAYGAFLVRHRGAVGLGVLAIVLLAAVGATRVPVEMSNLDNFPEGHPFREATEAVNDHFAAATSLAIVVEGGAPDAIKDPEVLHKMDALETWLRDREHVGSVQSLTGFIKQMHRVTHGDGMDQYRLPEAVETETAVEWVEEDGEEVEREVTFEVPGQALVAQYLALYEMSGSPDDFANSVTYDYATARINVFLDSDRASVLTEVHDDVRGFIDANFGDLEAQLTGMAELMRAVNEMVVEGQAWSIATSLLLVLLVSALVFRSPVLGAFATLPLFFSLFLNFGTMGLSGIALNVMTMATSSVAVGVGIDYAIHFVHRFQRDRAEGLDWGEAVRAALRSSGVAISLNAVTVALGFGALAMSQFTGVRHMGVLIALTMVTSAFAALTVLPVLFLLLKPRVFRTAGSASAGASGRDADAGLAA